MTSFPNKLKNLGDENEGLRDLIRELQDLIDDSIQEVKFYD
jgi:hypothetical protein